MSGFTFTKATKEQAKLRMALIGPSGSGKTYSALAVARGLGDNVALIDSEHGSASKYASEFEFDTLRLTTFAPLTYVQAIEAAAAAGYDVLVIDSLSHAWTGKEGALEQVDMATARSRSHNKFSEGWREVTPQHNALIEAILAAPMHVIATMRVKTEYVIEENDRGQKVPRKVGLAPVQRAGMEYEFDVVGDIDHDHKLIVSKSRCSAIADAVIPKPGEQLAKVLAEWLGDGAEVVPVDRARLDAALERLAELDPVTDFKAALDKASAKDHGRPVALLAQAEIDAYADRMEKHAATLEETLAANQGSGEGPSGDPPGAADDAQDAAEAASSHGASSSPSPDTESVGETPQPGTDGSPADGEATASADPGAPADQADSLFQAPTTARGSKRKAGVA